MMKYLRQNNKSKPQKILFGTVDIGYRIELYTKFIKQHYADYLIPESLSVYILPYSHYKTQYTYEYHYHKKKALLRWIQSFVNFVRCLFKYDIFHFLSGETLLTRKLRPLEFWIYKKLGKRIVMHFVGSDIRSEKYLYWKNENIYKFLEGVTDYPMTLSWQDKLIADSKKYADYILVSTPDLKEIISESEFYPVMLDLDKFLSELNNAVPYQKEPNEIVILHAPSNGPLKGTNHIVEILEEVKKISNYKLKIIIPQKHQNKDNETIYSVSRYELFRLYKTADIVIDQMIIGWYGLQSVESLAAGKQTICYIEEKFKTFLFPDCPIYIADVKTLKETIITCIENLINNKVNPEKQLEWVKKYHTIENNHSSLLKAWGIKI